MMSSRRNFFKIAILASSLPATKCLALDFTQKRGDWDLLSLIYRDWVHHYGQTPQSFWASLGQEINDPIFYKRRIKEDFINGDIFEFGGIVMSKTEAAGISQLLTL